MNRKNTLTVLLVNLLLTASLSSIAGVDEQSIFLGAKVPVSVLDLKMSQIQQGWWKHYVAAPDEETKKKHPLITQAGVMIELTYSLDDRISVLGAVTKIEGFLNLSAKERKQLVLDTLELVKSTFLYQTDTMLIDKKTGKLTGGNIENHHIKLVIMLNDPTRNDKNESIRLFLPSKIGVGQAGYKDGQFVFSDPYFLNLKVNDGVAVSGALNKFVIEPE